MKIITIKQPFASLIAAGLKEYEFRTWKTKYRGEILIHAGKGVDKKAMKKFAEYGFKLDNVEKLDPIPAKGKLSIWEIDYEGVI